MKQLMIGLLALLATPLGAAAANFVTPDNMGTGSLLFDGRDPGKYVEAPRVATDFDVTVTGPIARTRVTQQFRNPAKGWVEGVYVFPLPENAAVDTLKMVIGKRVIVGDIKEKNEARQVYEAAKAKGEKASLVEQERPNLFTNQIANIGPGETVVIQIEYQQLVHLFGGVSSLRVPMVVAPRYMPAPKLVASSGEGSEDEQLFTVSDSMPDRDRIQPPVLDPRVNDPVNPITLAVHLKPGFTLGAVKSSYHQVVAKPDGKNAEEITLANPENADRDFELTWQPAADKQPSVGLFSERISGSDYALVQITPPAVADDETHMPREVTFVVDNSGSMGGPSMDQAKESLLYALDHLDPADRFNIVRFDDTMSTVFPAPVAATQDNLEDARKFVSGLEAAGGTEMIPPLRAALSDDHPGDASTLRQIVFLTDGAIANEQEMFDLIAKARGRSRVFMIGIGSAPNSYLMTRAAELGRGAYTQIGEGSKVAGKMHELFGKLQNPAVTDMKVVASRSGIEVTPAILPDIYRGEPLTLLVKSKSRKGRLTISGTIAGKPWTESVELWQAKPGSGIAKLWARRAIDDVEVAQSLGQMTPDQADGHILSLALTHHLVCRVTSLVAVDKTPARKAGKLLTRADVPLNLPAGWDYDKVFGTPSPADERKASLDLDMIAVSATRPVAAHIPSQVHSFELPQTATFSRLYMRIGLMILGLALIVARWTIRDEA